MHIITRASVAVNGDVHLLSPGADVTELQRLIVAAVRSGGDFVDMVAAGNRHISVFFAETTAVTFSSEDIVVDADQVSQSAGLRDGDFDQSNIENWRYQ